VVSAQAGFFRIRFRADPVELVLFRGGLNRWLLGLGWPAADRQDAVLAITEACDNSVRQAGLHDGRAEVEVVARLVIGLDDRRIVATVRDEIVTIGSAGQAYGLGPTDRIGQRMPFVPPLCSLFVAWAGADAVESWLANLDPQMPQEDAQRYREMVDTVRRRGWSIALTGRPQIAFELALAQLSVRAPTEAQQQAVREAAVNLGHGSHEPAELGPDELYRVRNISAPVFDDSGAVVLMLTLIGLRKVLVLGEIERHRDRLLAATERVTRALGGRRPEPEQRP